MKPVTKGGEIHGRESIFDGLGAHCGHSFVLDCDGRIGNHEVENRQGALMVLFDFP